MRDIIYSSIVFIASMFVYITYQVQFYIQLLWIKIRPHCHPLAFDFLQAQRLESRDVVTVRATVTQYTTIYRLQGDCMYDVND